MDLNLTDEQSMLRDALRRLLTNESPVAVVRQMENDALGFPPALLKALAAMGVMGLTLPEEHGGMGLGHIDLAVVFEELGRALCPVPVLETSVLAAGIIARAGSAAQQAEWLPAIAAGEAVLTPAFLEPEGSFRATGIQLRAEPVAGGYCLNGSKYFVGYAAAAERLLTLVRSGPGAEDIDILLVDPRAPGVTLTRTESHALDPRYLVEFTDVQVAESARIGAPGSGWATWTAVGFDRMVALSAWFVGCAARDLELANAYAKERVQFDRPIGSFQAIAHQLADAHTGISGARYLAWKAAWARDRGRTDARRLAAQAFLRSAEAARFATRTGQQVLGGIGFTNDLDVQLFFRRAKQHLIAWANLAEVEDFVATSLIDGE